MLQAPLDPHQRCSLLGVTCFSGGNRFRPLSRGRRGDPRAVPRRTRRDGPEERASAAPVQLITHSAPVRRPCTEMSLWVSRELRPCRSHRPASSEAVDLKSSAGTCDKTQDGTKALVTLRERQSVQQCQSANYFTLRGLCHCSNVCSAGWITPPSSM